jgi:hypothetical protein
MYNLFMICLRVGKSIFDRASIAIGASGTPFGRGFNIKYFQHNGGLDMINNVGHHDLVNLSNLDIFTFENRNLIGI